MNVDRLRRFLNIFFTKEEIKSLILLEVVVGIILSISSLLIFLFITNAVLENQTILADNLISYFIYSMRDSWLTRVMWMFSLFGNQILIIGSIIVIIFLTKRKHKKETVIFSLLLFMGLAVTNTLKILLRVPRPNISALINENSFSYPSGHALNSLLFYATVSYFIFHFTRQRLTSVIVSTLFTALIFFIGLSRVYLGVHHPSDVLAGYIAGFWLFVTVILIDKTITYFRLIRESSKSS